MATEFVVTSISTGGDGHVYEEYYGPMVSINPHIKFFDGDRRGYVRVELTPSAWRTDLQMVDTVLDPNAGDRHARLLRGRERPAGRGDRLLTGREPAEAGACGLRARVIYQGA